MPRCYLRFVAARSFLAIALATCLATSGCRTGPLAEMYGWNPLRRSGPEETAYGPTAATRRQQLHEMAERAKRLSTAEKLQLAADLSRRMENEVDPVLRSDTVRALGQLASDQARDALRLAIKDAEGSVRIAACEAWQQIGGPEAITVLSEVLATDSDDDVRLAAARSLGAFREPEAAHGLAVALDDANPALQHRVMESLAGATGRRDLGHDAVAWRNYVESGAEPSRGPTLVDRILPPRR